jgi:hypothetical protein
MDTPNFLPDFVYLLVFFSIIALGVFLVQRKEYLDTYTQVYRKYSGQESFIKWIPKLIKYLLVAVVFAFVIGSIFFTIDSL